jgi:hypothetical protein
MISLCKWTAWYAVQEGTEFYVLIQFDLLMMSTVTLETCRKVKQIQEKVSQVGY